MNLIILSLAFLLSFLLSSLFFGQMLRFPLFFLHQPPVCLLNANSLNANSRYLSSTLPSLILGGKHALHVKPSRFPRATRRKRIFNAYYSPKPDSPWYYLVEEGLSHPGWTDQSQAGQNTEEIPTVDIQQMLEEERQRAEQRLLERREKNELKKEKIAKRRAKKLKKE